MTSNLEVLKKKRTGVRTQTTKLFNKIKNTLDNDDLDLEAKFDLLNICKDQLNEKYETLKKLNGDIEIEIPDAEFEREIESSEDYSEKIIEFRYKITKFVNEFNLRNQNNSYLKSETCSQNSNFATNIKLPKISINKFYGDSSSWLEFWGQYSNAIYENPSLSPVDKFSYLKSLLGGVAYNTVAGFSLTEENFESAVELLRTQYGRQDLVINAHMSKLLNLKPVKNPNNIKELRQLYDACEIQIRNLNSLGVTAGSYGHLLCPILLKLIPAEIALEFNRKRATSEKIDVEELLSFIKNEVYSREINFESTK